METKETLSDLEKKLIGALSLARLELAYVRDGKVKRHEVERTLELTGETLKYATEEQKRRGEAS